MAKKYVNSEIMKSIQQYIEKISKYYKIDAIDEVDLSQNFTIHYGLRKKFSL